MRKQPEREPRNMKPRELITDSISELYKELSELQNNSGGGGIINPIVVPLSNTVWINHDLREDNEEQRIFESYNDAILWIQENGNVNEDNQWQVMLPGGTIPEITLYEYINVSGIDGTRIGVLRSSIEVTNIEEYPLKAYISTVMVDNINLEFPNQIRGLTIYNSIIYSMNGYSGFSYLFATNCKFFGSNMFSGFHLDASYCLFQGSFNIFHKSILRNCHIELDEGTPSIIVQRELTTSGLTTGTNVAFDESTIDRWINLDSSYKKIRLIQSAADPVEKQIYSNESLYIVLLPDTEDVVINILFKNEEDGVLDGRPILNHLIVMVQNLGSTSKVTFNGPIFDIANPDLNSFDVNVTSEFELVRYHIDNIRENDKWIIKSISLNTMDDLFDATNED